MKRHLSSWTGRIVQMAILTKVVYKIEWNPNQKANTILHGNIKSNLKIYLETKKSLDIQINPVLPTPNKERKRWRKEGGRERKQSSKQRHHHTSFQGITEPKLSMVLAQSKYRSMEQNRTSRYKSVQLQAPGFWQKC